jgi:hypothetical protein
MVNVGKYGSELLEAVMQKLIKSTQRNPRIAEVSSIVNGKPTVLYEFAKGPKGRLLHDGQPVIQVTKPKGGWDNHVEWIAHDGTPIRTKQTRLLTEDEPYTQELSRTLPNGTTVKRTKTYGTYGSEISHPVDPKPDQDIAGILTETNTQFFKPGDDNPYVKQTVITANDDWAYGPHAKHVTKRRTNVSPEIQAERSRLKTEAPKQQVFMRHANDAKKRLDQHEDGSLTVTAFKAGSQQGTASIVPAHAVATTEEFAPAKLFMDRPASKQYRMADTADEFVEPLQ